ncbi:peptidoglycan D,D-transpeptidase FtsI family protein [Bifidobacterium ruminantium]|uniref:peptidoglycan D,D-transpeptidase FtsI family protein n=1 Tax=Bifidobacterium ruminantium TaxID=78346 RepID=UPI003D1727AE
MNPFRRIYAFFHKNLLTKTMAIGIILALMGTTCLVRLADIQLVNGKSMAQAAAQSRTTTVTLKARRGKILDTNGAILAQSVERYTIIGNPEQAQAFVPTTCTKQTGDNCHQINGKPVGVTGAAAVARLVAPVLGMDATELGAMLSISGQYVVLKKDVTPAVKRKISKLNLGGIVYAELSNERLYSNGSLMGSLLGGVNSDGKGVAGVEQMENRTLTGQDGYQVYQQGNSGVEIPGTMTESKEAVNGSDVTLTIDRDVQWYAEKVLHDSKSKYQAAWGIAMVQDVRSGDILALADSDTVEAGSDQAKMGASRAVSETFEPGSIGKVLAMSGMLQLGLHKIDDKFTVPDTVTADGQSYKDAETHGAEHWTLAGILQQSSNVGMILAGDKMTNEQRYDFIRKFGVGQDTGLNLPGESEGVLYPADSWDARTRNTVLFGQGYTVNVMQLTNAVAVIANKGVRKPQRIIKSITDADGHVEEQKPKSEATRVIDESVASQILNAMESVSDYYSNFVKVDGYRIAAKSGTAEVAGTDGRLSSIISDYSAIIPADDPRFVITVVLKDPQGSFGGLTAGPVTAQIGEFLMQKYEVPASAPRTDAIPVTW